MPPATPSAPNPGHSPLEKLSGLVERVTFHSEESGYCVLRLKVRGEQNLVTLVGHAPSVTPGKVRAIGASAMYGYQFHNMQLAAEKNGWTLFSTLQNHYNLIYREDERELIPVAK